jgi:hypothetical protein
MEIARAAAAVGELELLGLEVFQGGRADTRLERRLDGVLIL